MRHRLKLLIDLLPRPQAVADRLSDALREVELLRRLLQLCERAEQYRTLDRQLTQEVSSGR